MSKSSIRKLSPAAARLLLAYLGREMGQTFDDIVRMAGIQAYATVVQAREQLHELGFLVDANGRDSVVFHSLPVEDRQTDKSYAAYVQQALRDRSTS